MFPLKIWKTEYTKKKTKITRNTSGEGLLLALFCRFSGVSFVCF